MARLTALARPAAEWLLPRPAYAWLAGQARSARLAYERHALGGLAGNARLRGLHRGQRCFILAAGPSLRAQDLTRLAGEVVIAVSNTYVLPAYPVIAPAYHCVPDVFRGHGAVVQGFEDRFTAWLRDMDQRTGDAALLLSGGDKAAIEERGLFRGRRIHYLHLGQDWAALERAGLDLTRSIPTPSSVSVLALMAAIDMGFDDVYLLGCDHDWLLHHGVSRHAYEASEHVVLRTPGYSEWKGSDFEAHLRSTLELWQQYKALKRLADGRGVRIHNATGGGLLDVFPPARYEALVERSPGRRPDEGPTSP